MAVTIEDIRVVRAELRKFDAQQTDFAVRFHTAVVDANLRAASAHPIVAGDPSRCLSRSALTLPFRLFHVANDGLPAIVHMDMLDADNLLPAAMQTSKKLNLGCVGPH